MKKIIVILFLIVFCCSAVFAQTDNYVPAKWESYTFKKGSFAVSFPRLPIVIKQDRQNISQETWNFGAYSNGVAYLVSYSQELKDNPVKEFQKVAPFSKNNVLYRVAEIRQQFERSKRQFSELETVENGWQTISLTETNSVYKIYFNPQTNNFIELSAFQPNDSKKEADNFLASLKTSENLKGIEIGNGADSIIGDAPPKTSSSDAGDKATPAKLSDITNANTENKESFRIISKPSPGYTEAARRNSVTGIVRVKVTLSSWGQITDVAPVKKLSDGLTEQAIAAARKILFIPAKIDGKRVSKTLTIEYNFSIY